MKLSTPIALVFSLALAFATGLFIYWIYRTNYRGVMYNNNFGLTLVLMTLITTPVVMCIRESIQLSMGMVGALSIVRFRTAVKDPLDTAYMFWALTMGILLGAGQFFFAALTVVGIGALIIIEQKTGLREFSDTGTALDADISAPLIENVFEPNTPLHDGAMIIRNRRILAAACILQLSDDPTISKELGTRHRAALGISETTDAVALIVSEETGIISMAREGKLTRYLDAKALTQILTDLFQADSVRSLPARLQRKYRAEAG